MRKFIKVTAIILAVIYFVIAPVVYMEHDENVKKMICDFYEQNR